VRQLVIWLRGSAGQIIIVFRIKISQIWAKYGLDFLPISMLFGNFKEELPISRGTLLPLVISDTLASFMVVEF
jgi:hypothetical protein